MSTRAVLARARGKNPLEFDGVYLHNAAGPDELGPVLWNLLEHRYKFDPAAFAKEMLDGNPEGWSNIGCFGGALAKTWDGKTKISVEEHQDNFNNDREDSGPVSFQGDNKRAIPGIVKPPINEKTDNWGAVYVYVMADDGMHVLLCLEDGYALAASVPWGKEPDWDEVREQTDAAIDKGVEAEAQERLAHLATGKGLTVDDLGEVVADLKGKSSQAMQPTFDAMLSALRANKKLLNAHILESFTYLLNNNGRVKDAYDIFMYAHGVGAQLNGGGYMNMTYAAYQSKDNALKERALAVIEEVFAKNEKVITEAPGIFDNCAGLSLQLGKREQAFAYVQKCKDFAYKSFKDMAKMPEYAAVKDDPEFKKIFSKKAKK